MWHITCMQENQSNSWFLMVRNQIGNLTPDISFGHNLCFKCSNGSCKPILNIYLLKPFQWYKKFFNLMSFDPCYCLLKTRGSIGTSTPKVGVHLRMWRVHSFTLSYTFRNMKCDSQVSFLACTFASLYVGREPKVRVVTKRAWNPWNLFTQNCQNDNLWTSQSCLSNVLLHNGHENLIILRFACIYEMIWNLGDLLQNSICFLTILIVILLFNLELLMIELLMENAY
jgi:hypothetical protein